MLQQVCLPKELKWQSYHVQVSLMQFMSSVQSFFVMIKEASSRKSFECVSVPSDKSFAVSSKLGTRTLSGKQAVL